MHGAETAPQPPPLTNRRILGISVFWLSLNFLWGALLGVVLASQIRIMVPQSASVTLGLLFSAGSIPALVVPLVIGPISDRCRSRFGRRKPFIAGGVAIASVGLALLAAFGPPLSIAGAGNAGLAGFFAGFLVVQVGVNWATAPYTCYIPDLVPISQRGLASGVMAGMRQAGTLAGALTAGPLAQAGHFVAIYALLAAALVLGAVYTWRQVQEEPFTGQLPALNLVRFLKSLWIDPRRAPDFAWVWLSRGLITFGLWTVQPFLQYYLRDVVGTDRPAQMVGILSGTILVGAGISGLLFGRLSDRRGRKRIVVAGTAVSAAMVFTLPYCQNLGQAIAVAVVFGIAFGAYVSVDHALGSDVIPDYAQVARFMAIWHIAEMLPQAVAPGLAGALLASPGYRAVPGAAGETEYLYTFAGYQIIFGLSALFLLAGGLAIQRVRGSS